MTKILQNYQKNKEIKEVMPWKTFNKYIYQVYMAKAAEIQAEKLDKKDSFVKLDKKESSKTTHVSASPG